MHARCCSLLAARCSLLDAARTHARTHARSLAHWLARSHALLCRSVRAKQQLDSNWWLDSRDSHCMWWLDTMIESLNKEKLVISRQTLSAFPQTTLQNALDKLFRHVDKPCLHSQIVQTSPVDKLCRQTLSAKNPPKTVDKLCLHFSVDKPCRQTKMQASPSRG